jgi:aspartate/glutamate racemase
MDIYKTDKPQQSWYGISIGIIILNVNIPYLPGNVGNATTYPFPVQFIKVKEASLERLIKQQDNSLIKHFIDAAKELESQGVKAITGGCGFTALFQKEVASSVSVPVFLSSLLQIPFIFQILAPGQKIGVVTADKHSLTDRHFKAVGVDTDNIPLVIAGMEDKKEFRQAILEEKGTLDSSKIEKELLDTIEKMTRNNPNLGAILLECSDLPPYSYKVQQKTGLPVFDYITMINFVHTAVVKNKFQGYL